MAADDGRRRDETRVAILVSGRVQGVGFRESTRQMAEMLHVGGWVCNLADGRVEVHVEGPAAQVARAIAWCRQGPPGASVAGVETATEPLLGETTFCIRRTEQRW